MSHTKQYPMQFTGAGGEYFVIWIVNIALTLVTLGIYSAWAKVRRLQYFYRNTSLAGAVFEYHGDPKAILKGRIVGVVLFALYNFAGNYSVTAGIVAFALLAVVLPPLLVRSLRFRARNTSWRGLRFGFDGKDAGGYRVYLLWGLLSLASLYLLAPVWMQRIRTWQVNHSRYGATPFCCQIGMGKFYGIALKALGLILVCWVAAVASILLVASLLNVVPTGPQNGFWLGVLTMAILLFATIPVGAYVHARLQNLVWNHTTLGPHRFESALSARRLAFVMLTNFFAVLLSLGFYQPFAAVRAARCRLEAVTLIAWGSLDELAAGASSEVGAAGQETAEFFDFDIAL
jgi:uncharacterized membrane protein YjgN (DUF898 family)